MKSSTFWMLSAVLGLGMNTPVLSAVDDGTCSTGFHPGPFCSGDTGCPCGNNSTSPNHGCQHSYSNTLPLTGQGVELYCLDCDPSDCQVFLQGEYFWPMAEVTVVLLRSSTTQQPQPFGDGLLCLMPPVVRYSAVQTEGGSGGMLCSHSRADFPVSHGAGPGTFYYQLWYRNVPNFCTSDQFNSSNGITITYGDC